MKRCLGVLAAVVIVAAFAFAGTGTHLGVLTKSSIINVRVEARNGAGTWLEADSFQVFVDYGNSPNAIVYQAFTGADPVASAFIDSTKLASRSEYYFRSTVDAIDADSGAGLYTLIVLGWDGGIGYPNDFSFYKSDSSLNTAISFGSSTREIKGTITAVGETQTLQFVTTNIVATKPERLLDRVIQFPTKDWAARVITGYVDGVLDTVTINQPLATGDNLDVGTPFVITSIYFHDFAGFSETVNAAGQSAWNDAVVARAARTVGTADNVTNPVAALLDATFSDWLRIQVAAEVPNYTAFRDSVLSAIVAGRIVRLADIFDSTKTVNSIYQRFGVDMKALQNLALSSDGGCDSTMTILLPLGVEPKTTLEKYCMVNNVWVLKRRWKFGVNPTTPDVVDTVLVLPAGS